MQHIKTNVNELDQKIHDATILIHIDEYSTDK